MERRKLTFEPKCMACAVLFFSRFERYFAGEVMLAGQSDFDRSM